MDGISKGFNRKINILFGFACLLPVVQVVACSPAYAAMIINGPKNAAAVIGDFWLGFAIPQFLYPVLSALLFLIPLRMMHLKTFTPAEVCEIKCDDYLVFIPLFLLVSKIISVIVGLFVELFKLPTFDDAVPLIDTPLKAVVLVFEIAILPAFCEEFIYRNVFMRSTMGYGFGIAAFVSSFVFGLMHATLEQIPFAFVLGLSFAFVFARTKNYGLSVAMHFANNFLSCILLIIQQQCPEKDLIFAGLISTAAIGICGIIALVVFLAKKKYKLPEHKTLLPFSAGIKEVFKAPFFWLFTVIYIVLTVINTLSINS